MKNTPLTQIHIDLGAKMADFAGYNMPIQYSSISEEHLNVRQKVGAFDVSHMGEFMIKGKEALDFVQKVTSNDASKLNVGDIQYTCLPNTDGGIVDDFLLYRMEDDLVTGDHSYMLVVNSSNMEKDWNWISSYNNYDAKLTNISDQTGLIAVQGPKSVEILQKLTDVNLSDFKYYTFKVATFAGIEGAIISSTGYTGSGGFEIYVPAEHTEKLWHAVMEAGKDAGIKPCGLGARDTLRLEMGFCLYGNDIDGTTSPLEAGLGWITKLKKPSDFVGKDWLTQQKEAGLKRKLIGFTMQERRVPRHGYLIFDQDENEIGVVTSGTQSPSLDQPIGMGYVPIEMAVAGNKIFIQLGKKLMEATICSMPFVKI